MTREKPFGSGRRRGTPNKSTAEIREYARVYGPQAIDFYKAVLDDVTYAVETRLVAARELLNRGYGRPAQELNVQLQGPARVPDYFRYIPESRLALMQAWCDEARALCEANAPTPSDAAPPLGLGEYEDAEYADSDKADHLD
jgi:hypothetical protein